MDLPLARVFTTVLATLFLAAVTLKTLFPGDDPYRCRALQNTGRWIDSSRDEEGNRNSFHQWQPDGCIFNNYESDDIRRCMEGRPIVIVGDSTSQHVLHTLNRLLDKRRSDKDRKQKKLPRSQAYNVTYHGQLVQRLPNAWVSSHGVPGQEYFVQNLELFAEEKRNLPPIENQEGPAIIYVAAGIWFTKQKGTVNADAAGNVPWTTRFGVFKDHFTNLSKFISNNTPRYDPFTAPMDPYDGIGNQVFYAPATEPSYQGHNPGRIDGINRKKAEVVDMQNWLHDINSTGLPIIWSVVGVTTGENKTWSDPLGTGFHVIPQIAETRANIILNMRCNAKLDRMKSYPYSRTCCTDYGGKPVTQLGLVAFGIIYLAACIVCEVLDLFANRESPQWRLLNMRAGSLALAILMCYYADRTQMMAKGSKLWQLNDFIILCVLCTAILLITIRSSRPPPPGDISLTREENNQSFLSRDQTEEWKGWM